MLSFSDVRCQERTMIRCWTLAAIAGVLVASSSVDAVAADPLPIQTFKILPAALAIEVAEAAIASCKSFLTAARQHDDRSRNQ